ncbi:hypothetical protein [Nitratireductor sp. ZSWI3]|uniref:hypothetical protein n=1 Tax=Nitratireductor sp. ZSWI3 TaxID=2966359 RepID=UPI00214FF4F8|nr:hypothetical protein [Nitratireductor sp. ZSWI3]MCR4269165.1 hypothetical protein [Nitratireductor sp. ZSWI3]
MQSDKPAKVPSLIGKMLANAPHPNDIRLLAQRFHDHALEPRSTPEETRALVADLGYGSIDAFCAAAGLPAHLADRWTRFGISGEMRQVLLLIAAQRRAMIEAVQAFEAMTHVGLDDFMRERGLL